MQKKIYERVPVANPELPERIGRLNELAYNLWWAWNPKAGQQEGAVPGQGLTEDRTEGRGQRRGVWTKD